MSELTSFLSQIGGALSAQATGGQQGLQNFLATVARQQERELAGQQRADEQLRQQIFQKGRDDRQQAHDARMFALRSEFQKDERKAAQAYGTSERKKAQEFTSSERQAAQAEARSRLYIESGLSEMAAMAAAERAAEESAKDRASRENIAQKQIDATRQETFDIETSYARSLQGRFRQSPEGQAEVRALVALHHPNPAALDKIDLGSPESLPLIIEAVKLGGGPEGASGLLKGRSVAFEEVEELGRAMFGSGYRLSADVNPFVERQRLRQSEQQLASYREKIASFETELALLMERANTLAESNAPALTKRAQLQELEDRLTATQKRSSDFMLGLSGSGFLNPGAVLEAAPKTIDQGIDGVSSVISIAKQGSLHDAAQQWSPSSGMDNFPLSSDPNVDFTEFSGAVGVIEKTQTEWKERSEAVSTFSAQDYADAASPVMQSLISSGVTFTPAESFELKQAQEVLAEYPDSSLSDLMLAWRNSDDPQEKQRLDHAIKAIAKVNPSRVAMLRGVTDHYNLEMSKLTGFSATQTTDTQGPLLRNLVDAESFGTALEQYGTPNSSVVNGATIRTWDSAALSRYAHGEKASVAGNYMNAARGDVDLALELFNTGQMDDSNVVLSRDAAGQIRQEIERASGLTAAISTPVPEFFTYNSTGFNQIIGGNGREGLLPEKRAQRSQRVLDSLMSRSGVSITERAREQAVIARDKATMLGRTFSGESTSDGDFLTLRDLVEIFSEPIPQLREVFATKGGLREVIPNKGGRRFFRGPSSVPFTYQPHYPEPFDRDFAYGSGSLSGSGMAHLAEEGRHSELDTLRMVDIMRAVNLDTVGRNLPEDVFQMLTALQDQLRGMDPIGTLATFGKPRIPGVGMAIAATEDAAPAPSAGLTGSVDSAALVPREAPGYRVHSQENFERAREEIRAAQQELTINRSMIDTVVDTAVGEETAYTLLRGTAVDAEYAELEKRLEQLEIAEEAQQFADSTTTLSSFGRVARRAILDGATNLPSFMAALGAPTATTAMSGASTQQFMGDINNLQAQLGQLDGERGIDDVRELFKIITQITPKTSARGGAAPSAAVEADYLRAVKERTDEAYNQYLDIYNGVPANTPASRFRPPVAERLNDYGYDSIKDRETRALLIWAVMDQMRSN